ncbi:STAS domain-containing protein [Exilibacterium tricleocarpae]|uniref:STAS domain-containing protein n=1 Tax=Exilibacterium tricleocarpae TaxID=2591008 RepID=A0A545U3Q9_9GAMM|nr:STAS domain-containing protein [Exilibacterium tricleocarpae]TQV84109.1 STAS domain-containing protein [Exilibacterium tricleocarpae]
MAISTTKSASQEVTILLGDTFDFSCVDEFRRAYEQVDHADCKRFVIDFRNTQYMDSSALGMLINMEKFWREHEASICIINANQQLKKIFSISRFDKKFNIE